MRKVFHNAAPGKTQSMHKQLGASVLGLGMGDLTGKRHNEMTRQQDAQTVFISSLSRLATVAIRKGRPIVTTSRLSQRATSAPGDKRTSQGTPTVTASSLLQPVNYAQKNKSTPKTTRKTRAL